MARLYLLRHARAGWAQPGMRDFDRPLDPPGAEEAVSTGAAMRACGYQPDLTLCSNARRARETLEGVAGGVDTGRVVFLDTLYTEDAAFYLDAIREHGHLGSLLVIGHNPMMEDLTVAVSGEGDDGALAALHHGFPTAGLAVLNFEGGLSEAAPGKGYLEAFLTPAGI
ncbi:SixA phosphatase family protein [Aquamicrobium ahrensii]|uniref:Phosphohistidine phosphatase n=1 Tax=Aquamicrobium ahrensii TaxID=469551 RepID=A0ABV2KGD3_9HYPH